MFVSTDSPAGHCPLVKSEHCNFTKTEAPADEIAVSTASVFECCGLKFNFVIGKLEASVYSAQSAAIVTISKTVFGPPRFFSKDYYETVSYRQPLFESSDIHLKNCVFRT